MERVLAVTPTLSEEAASLQPALAATMDSTERTRRLKAQSTEICRSVVEMIGRARLGHIGGDFSVADILTTLFFAVLKLDPAQPVAPCATVSFSAKAIAPRPSIRRWPCAGSFRPRC